MTPNDNLYDFYRSSPMREGVLCWYPFERGASALDLSGDVLTDLLNDRCERVVPDAGDGERFDYVVLLDPWDFSVDALKGLYGKLNPRGRLLLAYENPFALRYWSGKASPKTRLSYDPLLGRDGRVSKAEMRLRLERAGFEGQKWYYPLTDHWFAEEIYSEGYLPNEYFNQRFFPYISDDGFLQFDERPLYRETVRSGAFEFMCGAYLIEARICGKDAPCPVDYAAVTAYREPEKRFATTVRNDGTVRKTPLHPDGAEGIRRIYRNHEDLARLGVNVVKTRIQDGAIVMPRIDLPTLWDYWAKKLTDGVLEYEEMASHFDRIRDAVYQASAKGKCYWELVPANCFYDEQENELIFFDQEYCWDNRSPHLAITRALGALLYSPVFSADLRSECWLVDLVQRYGLGNRWDELKKNVDNEAYEEVFGSSIKVLYRETAQAGNAISRREQERL